MKLIPFTLVASLMLGLTAVAAPAPSAWITDLAVAQKRAEAEGKLLLVNFTGSDWCPWCVRLQKEIFSTTEFADFARGRLVLVEIDFPRQKPQSSQVKLANRALAQRYDVEGYPTVLLLDAKGKVLNTSGYAAGGPKPFLAALAGASGGKLTAPGAVTAREPATGTTGLVLKGVSGSKQRRSALINGATLMAGEGANIQVEDRRVRLRCLEIRERSVLVSVDGGQPSELHLREGL